LEKRLGRNRWEYFTKPVNEGSVKSNKFVGVLMPFNKPRGIFYQSITNSQQLYSNVRNLLLTAKGERYMLPTFGTNLRYILFENITSEETFVETIKSDIIGAFKEWMPFLTLEKLVVDINSDDSYIVENDHAIKISFTLKLRETTIYLPIQIFISVTGGIEIPAVYPENY
jgi:phage baseplate assembly protein W